MDAESLRVVVREKMDREHLTYRKAADASGVLYVTLWRFLCKKRPTTSRTIDALIAWAAPHIARRERWKYRALVAEAALARIHRALDVAASTRQGKRP